MRYHIDTIPVWDAMKQQGECFLCALRRRTELEEAERFLGASVMEPDIRTQVNEIGFCANHQKMLFASGNRLGHSLMLQTHLAEIEKKLEKISGKLDQSAGAYASASALAKLRDRSKLTDSLQQAAKDVAAISSRCVLCERMAENMQRYLHTFFHLYTNDAEFRTAFEHSKGVCLPDTAALLDAAPTELSGKDAAIFAQTLLKLQRENLARTQEDISWFIKKYDYRYDNESWKNARDATERTVNKLRGWCVGEEPNPGEKK